MKALNLNETIAVAGGGYGLWAYQLQMCNCRCCNEFKIFSVGRKRRYECQDYCNKGSMEFMDCK